jgi:ABC-type uncharacterized transport system auxiliary subunit
MKREVVALAVAGLVSFTTGCVFSGKTEAPSYYRVEPSPRPAGSKLKGVAIKVRRLRAAPYLGDRIVWRSSPVDVGFYESRRWIEPPADVVERAVHDEVFGALGMEPAAGSAITLELELSHFEEVIAPTHEAEVVLGFELEDAAGRRVARDTLVARTRVARGDEFAGVARSMGAAIDEVIGQLSERLVAALGDARMDHAHLSR